MTRTTNARIAGFTFLFYIAAGIASMVLFGRATGSEGIAAQLAGFLGGPLTSLIWLLMLAFEVPLALWLLINGVAGPGPMRSAV